MFFNFYHSVYFVVLLVSAVLCIWYLPKLKQAYIWLAILVIMTLITELFAKHLALSLHISNNIIYHFFTPVEYALYMMVFIKFSRRKLWHRLMWWSIGLLVLAEILNTHYFQPLHYSNTNIMILESVFLVFFSLILFSEIKDDRLYDNLLQEGIFWFNSAVLLYYTFNILVWGFHSIQVYNLVNPPVFIYNINLIFSAVLYTVFAYAVHLSRRVVKTH